MPNAQRAIKSQCNKLHKTSQKPCKLPQSGQNSERMMGQPTPSHLHTKSVQDTQLCSEATRQLNQVEHFFPPLDHRYSRCLYSTLTVPHNSGSLRLILSLHFGYCGVKWGKELFYTIFLWPEEVNKNTVYLAKLKTQPFPGGEKSLPSVESGNSRPGPWAFKALPHSQFF